MHTDLIMKNIWLNLAKDFRRVLGPDYLKRQEALVQNIESDAKGFRKEVFPQCWQASPWVFKTTTQMATLFKRYTFSSDIARQVVERNSIKEFVAYQAEIKPPNVSQALYLVLQEARHIVKDVLGDFDANEHLESCQFGKRANRFVPKRLSYLDVKAANPSGSNRHLKWYRKMLQADPLLMRINKTGPESTVLAKSHAFDVVDDLALTAVPKNWKTCRIIVPNTVVGAFHSYGLGLMIAKRLKDKLHLDISTLPSRHALKARLSSSHRKYVTADLSKASDTFSYELVCRLVPYKWLKVLKEGRIPYVVTKGRRIFLRSFMAMGIGYTFPLQTLLFYALIKAVQNLLHKDYPVSVYGDDLIYHRSIHLHVAWMLRNCGFKFNAEKTYVAMPFRESCGSDYFKGIDVRPFMPEENGKELRGRRLSAFIYKSINGLLRRWTWEEIPDTLWYLHKLAAENDGIIYQVPPSFPDYAGVKVECPRDSWHYVPWSPVVWRGQAYAFRALTMVSEDRYVASIDAYYWSWHRCRNQDISDSLPWYNLGLKLEQYLEFGWDADDDDRAPSSITWRRCSPKKRVRSSVNGRRYWRKIPTVPDKMKNRFATQLHNTSVWF